MAENILNKWREGLSRTRKTTFGRIASLFGVSQITDETWEDLEAMLIQADLGIETSEAVMEALWAREQAEGMTRTDELQAALQEELRKLLVAPPEITFPASPTIILVVGVNGSGKTTSIAKLGKRFTDQGKKVIFGAADTFRAAAVEQLQAWGERLDIPVIAGQPGGDPGAVAYDTVQAAQARGMDVALIDTAGRLHT
ncbi:MAG: signal recognition particle-docking protein FtsY, partial [Anaerolineae bacterium]